MSESKEFNDMKERIKKVITEDLTSEYGENVIEKTTKDLNDVLQKFLDKKASMSHVEVDQKQKILKAKIQNLKTEMNQTQHTIDKLKQKYLNKRRRR